jgi:NMD protein affecting ribosome stability and mRNA decay
LLFTFDVAREIARDEEFVKQILLELKRRGFVVEVNKNPEGIVYKRRARWKLSDKAYKAYKSQLNIN